MTPDTTREAIEPGTTFSAGVRHEPADGLARAFAARVSDLHWSDLPSEAVHWARVGILDTIGVTLAGSREDAPRLVAQSLDLDVQ